MKKLTALVLALVLALGFTACNGSKAEKLQPAPFGTRQTKDEMIEALGEPDDIEAYRHSYGSVLLAGFEGEFYFMADDDEEEVFAFLKQWTKNCNSQADYEKVHDAVLAEATGIYGAPRVWQAGDDEVMYIWELENKDQVTMNALSILKQIRFTYWMET